MKARIASVLMVVLAVGLLVAGPALAAEFVVPSEKGMGSGSVTIGEGRRNVYSAGGSINVNSPVGGDLVAAGGSVTVNGSVEDDLMAAGGTLLIDEPVGGDARLAGGNITVNSPIGGDLLVGGGSVSISTGATVTGDLISGAGTLEVNGPVLGGILVSGGEVYLNSAVTGEVNVRAGKLTFGPQARVAGKITYKGPSAAEVREGAQVSAIEFTKVDAKGGRALAGIWTVGFLISLVAGFISAWLLSRFYRPQVAAAVGAMRDNPWASLGIGFAALLLAPIASLVIAMTLVGFYVALIIMATYLLLFLVSGVIAIIFVGSSLWKWMRKAPDLEFSWRTALLGAVVMRVVTAIPVVGWIVGMVILMMAFGVLIGRVKPRS